MFLGFDRHTLDSKNRLTVPAKFRGELTEGGFVMRGFDQNLMVLTPAAFEVVSRRLNRMSLTNAKARMLRRRIFSSAEQIGLDKSGRFLIPEYLRLDANLDGEVVLNGAGDYFEIWSPENWAQEEVKTDAAGLDPALFDDLVLATSE
jgi:MraZ protein